MTVWHPIATAPTDGTAIVARRNPEDWHGRGRRTWWGKTSHIAVFGWCIGTDPEDINLWRPDEWHPIARRKTRSRSDPHACAMQAGDTPVSDAIRNAAQGASPQPRATPPHGRYPTAHEQDT